MASEQVERNCANCVHQKTDGWEYPCDKCDNYSFWESSTESPINPTHYSRFPIQPLTFITENKLDYLQGNIIKYVCRYPYKGGVTDLKKAQRYLEELIKKEEANAQQPA